MYKHLVSKLGDFTESTVFVNNLFFFLSYENVDSKKSETVFFFIIILFFNILRHKSKLHR